MLIGRKSTTLSAKDMGGKVLSNIGKIMLKPACIVLRYRPRRWTMTTLPAGTILIAAINKTRIIAPAITTVTIMSCFSIVLLFIST